MASTQLKVSISFRIVSNQRSAIQQTPWEVNPLELKVLLIFVQKLEDYSTVIVDNYHCLNYIG